MFQRIREPIRRRWSSIQKPPTSAEPAPTSGTSPSAGSTAGGDAVRNSEAVIKSEFVEEVLGPSSAAQAGSEPVPKSAPEIASEAHTNPKTQQPSLAISHASSGLQDVEEILSEVEEDTKSQQSGASHKDAVQTHPASSSPTTPVAAAELDPIHHGEASTSAHSSVQDHAADLWNISRGRLDEADPKLAYKYNLAVEQWLGSKGYIASRPRRNSTMHFPDNNSFDNEYSTIELLDQAASMIEDADTYEAGSETHIFSREARSPSQVIRTALKEYPSASIVWIPSYMILQHLSPSEFQTETFYSKFISVTSKTEWYIGLSRLRSRDGGGDLSLHSSSLPDDDLIALYQSVLAYHMHAAVQVCLEKRDPEQISLDSQLEKISACENRLVGKFGQLRLHSQLVKFRETAEKPPEQRDESPTALEKKLLTSLNMEQKPHLRRGKDKYGTRSLLYDIAKGSPQFEEFVKWGDKDDCRILWVKGGSGTGKSMLLQVMILRLPATEGSNTDNNSQAPYYLCNNTCRRQVEVISAVKHLIYGVLRSQPDLYDHVSNAANEREGITSLEALYHWSKILYSIIQDVRFAPTFFVVDGVEQFLGDGDPSHNRPVDITNNENICWDSLGERGLVELLRLIIKTLELTDNVKWVLSVDDEKCKVKLSSQFTASQQDLILGASNPDLQYDYAKLVHKYAARKASEIGNVGDQHYRSIITETLTKKILSAPAPTNFLWTDLALDIVRGSTAPWNTARKLDELIQNMSTIGSIYDWTNRSIRELPNAYEDSAYCISILSATATTYRPLSLSELVRLIELPVEVEPAFIVNTRLSAFLEVFEGAIHFKHVSARDFVRRSMKRHGLQLEHFRISQRCLKLVLAKLNCKHQADNTSPNASETGMDYITTMWIKHLSEIEPAGHDPKSTSLANHLLSFHLMDWLELMQPRDAVTEAMSMMSQLNAAIDSNTRAPEHIQAYLGSSINIIPEVITFMRSHQRWKPAEEDDETDASKNSPMEQLLFSNDLPNLRKTLLPIHFKDLATYPQVSPEHSRDDCVHVLPHNDFVRGCCFSPDGQLVATACDDGMLHIWDTRQGILQQLLGESTEFMLGVAMSRLEVSDTTPNSRTILTAFDEREVYTWYVTGKNVAPLPNVTDHTGEVQCVAVSAPAGKLAVGLDNGIEVWDMVGNTWARAKGFEGLHDSSVRCVEFSPNGRFLASTSGPDITIWDVDTGVELRAPAPHVDDSETPQGEEASGCREETEEGAAPPVGHTRNIDGLAFSPDSEFLASGSDDTTARIWKIDKHNAACKTVVSILDYHTSYVNTVSFSADGTLLATGSSDNIIGIWKNTAQGGWGEGETRELPYRILHGHSSTVYRVSFSPHGKLLASSSSDGSLRMWDLNKLDVGTSEAAPPDPPTGVDAGPGHGDTVTCVAVSEDGKTIASASHDGTVCFWDGLTGRRQRTKDKVHEAEVLSMTFSADGKRLVSTSIDASVFVWTIPEPSKPLPIPIALKDHHDWVRDAKFDVPGQQVVTGSDDGKVRVYDVLRTKDRDIEPKKTYHYHGGYVYSVIFSPNGKWIASGDDDRVIVWRSDQDVQSPPENMNDDQVQSPIRTVIFSADGQQVVSLSKDETIAVWMFESTDGPKCRIVEKDPLEHFGYFRSMRIDPKFPNVILTELGALYVDIQGEQPGSKELAKRYPPGWGAVQLKSDRDDTSIKLSGGITISLPSFVGVADDFLSCRVQRDTVVIGCKSGEVLVLRFNAPEGLGEDSSN